MAQQDLARAHTLLASDSRTSVIPHVVQLTVASLFGLFVIMEVRSGWLAPTFQIW